MNNKKINTPLKKNSSRKIRGYVFGVLAALIYNLNVPLFGLFTHNVPSSFLTAISYFGAALGLYLALSIKNVIKRRQTKSEKPSKKEKLYIFIIIMSHAIASLLVMYSLRSLNSSTVSILQVLETTMTVVMSIIILKDYPSKKIVVAIIMATLAALIVSIDDLMKFQFSPAVLLVVLASLCWGTENCMNEKIRKTDPAHFVMVKCVAVGIISAVISFLTESVTIEIGNLLIIAVIGFVTYGIGILLFFISTQYIGATKASILFAFGPIAGVLYALVIYQQAPTVWLLVSMALIVISIYLTASDKKSINKINDQALN